MANVLFPREAVSLQAADGSGEAETVATVSTNHRMVSAP
mgnify:CR=1 FL=1